MRVAVTGASGLVGSALVPALRAAGHDVVTLVRREPASASEIAWDPARDAVDGDALHGVGAAVHLAGAGIGRRWTRAVRSDVLESRTRGTALLARTLAALEPRPGALLAASAVGYYGLTGDEELTEESPRGTGFLADVVDAWEDAAAPARERGIRVVHLRQGIVLAPSGGALARMRRPFRLGVGGRVGDGRQWWSWVTLEDAVRAYLFLLESELAGPVNVTAPEPVRNRDFASALGAALRRPAVVPLPSFAVGLAFGEMGRSMLLSGQRVVPARLAAAGFAFAHPTIGGALDAVA